MAKSRKSPPSYRYHKQSGQAVVTLPCRVSGKRRDVLLGEYDSAESWAEYARVIADWEAAGRVLDNSPGQRAKAASGVTVAEVMLDYWENQLQRYGVTDPNGRLPSGLYAKRSAVRMTRATAGSMPAHEFGPAALRQVRQAMVDQDWTRDYVNQSVALVIRAFEEAVSREVVTPEAVVGLKCVKPLKRGELGVREGEKVKGVPSADVEAVKPYLSRQMVAIIDLMRLTGARCDEIVNMRSLDIDTSGEVWCYRPRRHKSEQHGHDRLIHVGPKAQAVIQSFRAGRPVNKPLFSPAEAEAERLQQQHAQRKTPANQGNRPGTNRKQAPAKAPREQYDTTAVRRAIQRACQKAGVQRWSPHQLRHTAATEIRRAAGVEAAAAVLGHASPTLTDAVYAERDYSKAAEVIARVG
jgi:integrase